MATKKDKTEDIDDKDTGNKRVVCYLSAPVKAKLDALKKSFNMSNGDILGQFLTHYGPSFRDKHNKLL